MFETDSTEENGRAVSPVIGVILMVAITVILAAVIAAFVLDLGQGQGANPQAGITFDQSNDNVTITVNSVERADSLIVNGTNDCNYIYSTTAGSQEAVPEASLGTSAGDSVTVHIGDAQQGDGTSKLDLGDVNNGGVEYACSSSGSGSGDYDGNPGSGSIQIIGSYDGSESVIAEYDV
ncbi:type IV pilin [Natrinema thermotolerans]